MRNPLLFILIAISMIVGIQRLCSAEEKREEKPRFKGVELYSWKSPTGDWMFVLLNGTNRRKTEKEVKGANNKVSGIAELKKSLAPLAIGEQVFWTHGIQGFEYPPAEAIKEIQTAAKDLKIDLTVDDGQ